VLDALCNKFGVVIDWTSQNIVPYIETLCKKFITFEIATSIMWICFWLLLIAILLPICLNINKKVSQLQYGWNTNKPITDVGVVLWILCGIAIAVAVVIIPVQIHDIIEAITFPEKTIIEYIRNLIQAAK
jgi:hypothetical protein